MHTIVKKWYRDKDSGILANGGGPDILVRKADLVGCQFLKAGVTVEFECHQDEQGLLAKMVRLSNQKTVEGQNNGKRNRKVFRFGVMT